MAQSSASRVGASGGGPKGPEGIPRGTPAGRALCSESEAGMYACIYTHIYINERVPMCPQETGGERIASESWVEGGARSLHRIRGPSGPDIGPAAGCAAEEEGAGAGAEAAADQHLPEGPDRVVRQGRGGGGGGRRGGRRWGRHGRQRAGGTADGCAVCHKASHPNPTALRCHRLSLCFAVHGRVGLFFLQCLRSAQ